MKETIVASIVLERTTELIKSKLPDKWAKRVDGLVISSILGIVFALVYNLDIVSSFGLVTEVRFFNNVITGLFLTGGSAMVNALIEAVQSISENGSGVIEL